MRRLFWATILALGWMTSPWLVAAEEANPRAVDVLVSMNWCLPPQTQARWLTEGVRGLPWMQVRVDQFDFSLAPSAPSLDEDPMSVTSPHHPDVTLVFPAIPIQPADFASVKQFWMLAAGCFVLSDSR